MQIKLTKEEWEFLRSGTASWIKTFEDMPSKLAKPDSLIFAEKLLEKLGSEWVDDETII